MKDGVRIVIEAKDNICTWCRNRPIHQPWAFVRVATEEDIKNLESYNYDSDYNAGDKVVSNFMPDGFWSSQYFGVGESVYEGILNARVATLSEIAICKHFNIDPLLPAAVMYRELKEKKDRAYLLGIYYQSRNEPFKVAKYDGSENGTKAVNLWFANPTSRVISIIEKDSPWIADTLRCWHALGLTSSLLDSDVESKRDKYYCESYWFDGQQVVSEFYRRDGWDDPLKPSIGISNDEFIRFFDLKI